MSPYIRSPRGIATMVAGMGVFVLCLGMMSGPARGTPLKTSPVADREAVHYRVTGEVYFGLREKFSKPCTLRRRDVFEVIPAYRTIKEEGLDKSSARYYFLIEKANRVFRAAVHEVAGKLGYDLVVERGGIKGPRGVRIPDITRDVIREIRAGEKETSEDR